FTLLWAIAKTMPPPGTVFWSFITGYGLCRMLIEFVREPDAHLGFIFASFSMGQLLSFPMVVVGICMLAFGYQRRALIQARNMSE
ncbi:MAG: prolipoprotein diacylglyceryl transferase family protein, partial [Nitrospirota bacterium]